MKIIPTETYEIFSEMSNSKLEMIILDVFQKNSYRFSWDTEVNKETLIRKGFYASGIHPFPYFGFKPDFHGKIKTLSQGKTEIILIAELNKNTKRLFLIWICVICLFVGISLPIVIIELFYRESQIWTMIPIIFFIVGYCTVSLIFFRKSRTLKSRLKDVL